MRLPLLTTLILLIPAVLIDWYIWSRVPRRGWWRFAYMVGAFLTNALMVLVICLPKRDADTDIIPIMWLLYVWVTIYFAKFAYCVCSLIGLLPRLWKGRAMPLGRWLGIPAAVVIFCAMWYGALWGRRDIQVTEVTVHSPKLPAGFEGLRILQFSDAHVGTWGTDTTFVSKLVERINSLKPDMIVFTGDIVNRKTSELHPFEDILSRLHAPLGVYSILGNHDYGDYTDWPTPQAKEENLRQMREAQKRMGWHLLDNKHVFVRQGGDSIALIGVENWGEAPFKCYGDLKKAYPDANDANFKLLLTHNPMHWHQIVRHDTDIDLTLSGHTHAMQFMIGSVDGGISPSSMRYPEWAGIYSFKKSEGDLAQHLYVNIGSGEVAVPSRIGAAPELTLITLEK